LTFYSIQKISGVTINTVDSIQSQERDIVIVTTGKTNGIDFLDDSRLGVALTRAKHCLVVCGNFPELTKREVWNKLWADAVQRKIYFPVDEGVERPVEKLLKCNNF
jgi:superfamily I DNA and/or RNA helicase